MRRATIFIIFFFACAQAPEPVNNSPEIISILPSDSSIASDTTLVVECIAIDDDKDELTYNWSSDEGTFDGTGNIVTWIPPNKSGNFNIICEVSDLQGGRDRSNVFIQVIRYDTLSLSFNDLFLYIRSSEFSKGPYYFTHEQNWIDFQLSHGVNESEITPSGVDFSKSILIVIFNLTRMGCENNYQSLVSEVKRYKNDIIVYYEVGQFYGTCFADMDPYQTISVNVTDVKVKFEYFW